MKGPRDLWQLRRRKAWNYFVMGKTAREVSRLMCIGYSTAHRWRQQWLRAQSRQPAIQTPRPYPGARNLYGW